MKDEASKAVAWALIALAAIVAGPESVAAEEEGPGEQDSISGPLRSELREYWSVDRDLPAVADRLYERDDRFGFGIYGGIQPSEPFYLYAPVGARLEYSFSEEWGLEVGGQYELSSNTDLTDFLEARAGGASGFDTSTDAEDKHIWRATAGVVWHPFYGKWALLQRKFSHIALPLAFGAGVAGVDRPGSLRNESESAIVPEIYIGAGIHFWLAESVILRTDWRTHAYLGPDFETETLAEQGFFDRLQLPTEFLLGLTYLF